MAKNIIAQARTYWDRIRAGHAMPRREDIDPAEIPRLLPFVMLVDVLEKPLDFKFRLVGTAIQSIVAGNYLGRRFSELPHMAQGNAIWSEYEMVAEQRRPLSGGVPYVGTDREVLGIRHCLMPLSKDGTAVNMIFVAVEIDRR